MYQSIKQDKQIQQSNKSQEFSLHAFSSVNNFVDQNTNTINNLEFIID